MLQFEILSHNLPLRYYITHVCSQRILFRVYSGLFDDLYFLQKIEYKVLKIRSNLLR